MDWLYTDVTPEEMAEVNAICGQEAAQERAAAEVVRTRETIRSEVEFQLSQGRPRQAAALTRMARGVQPSDFLRRDAQKANPDTVAFLAKKGVSLPANATKADTDRAFRAMRGGW